jgi:putative glutamine amidotransferase
MKKQLTLLLVLAIFIFYSCSNQNNETATVTIGISKTNSNYSSWIERNGENTRWINLYPLGIDSVLKVLSACDGLLVTGGEDVYPGHYNKLADTSRCGSFDLYRDSLELALIRHALGTGKPVFGVCRGLQILNVALGGTLIIDIPDDFDTIVIHRQKDWKNCYHNVHLNTNSYLFKVAKTTDGIVNSNHHQGIDKMGTGLMISSYALDSLPESIEWLNPQEKGFLMAVQWHPERMEKNHPLSKNPAVVFIDHAREYQKVKN